MHDIKWIRENAEQFDLAMKKRGVNPVSSRIVELNEEKKQLVTLIQRLQQARNEKAKIIAELGVRETEDSRRMKKDAADIKDKLAKLEYKLSSETELESFLSSLPNIPDDSVPVGVDEKTNKEVKKVGNITKFSFKPKPHYEIGENLKLMDFVDSAKMSGSRFVTLKGQLARLERALANFMLDVHTKQFGFVEISPPLMVRDEAMFNAGQLPKFEEDSFKVYDNFRLIPTSEVPLVNYVADKIIKKDEFPLRYVAYTPCFRAEAGSAGRDTRGMIRLHQFAKVELVSIVKPEDSSSEHEYITNAAEEILKLLKLPYRVMLLSSGDMGFCAKKTYDLEVWLPSQEQYREISSCSNCGDFQARRLKARFTDDASKEKIFVHTLNGSGIAVGRAMVAILENYQNEDGSISVPEILVPYMDGLKAIK